MKLTDKIAGRIALWTLIAAVIIVGTITYNSFGVDWPIRYDAGMTLDSIRILFMELPVESSSDTLKDTTTGAVNYFDTTWTVTAGVNHMWLYIPFYPGNDSGGPTTPYYYHGIAGGADIQTILDSAAAYPSTFYGPSGAGTAAYVIGFYTVDTTIAGVYDTTSGVTLNIYDMTYSLIRSRVTSSSGYTFVNLDADTFIAGGNSGGIHDWELDTFVVTAATTRLLKGFELWTAPVSVKDKVASVVVTVIDNKGDTVVGVWVTAQLIDDDITDSAGHVINNFPQEVKTNALGKAVFECMWSSYIIPATKWRFTTKAAHTEITQDKTVPRQTTYEVDLSE